MSGARSSPCARCAELPAAENDHQGWCERCRAQVLRLSGIVAAIVTVVFAGFYIALSVLLGWNGESFLIPWIFLGGVLGLACFKIARRVAFELIGRRRLTPRSDAG
ncbi:hypothetical protein BH23GEM4_BH23GEM4_14600 [soil metagenome]